MPIGELAGAGSEIAKASTAIVETVPKALESVGQKALEVAKPLGVAETGVLGIMESAGGLQAPEPHAVFEAMSNLSPSVPQPDFIEGEFKILDDSLELKKITPKEVIPSIDKHLIPQVDDNITNNDGDIPQDIPSDLPETQSDESSSNGSFIKDALSSVIPGVLREDDEEEKEKKGQQNAGGSINNEASSGEAVMKEQGEAAANGTVKVTEIPKPSMPTIEGVPQVPAIAPPHSEFASELLKTGVNAVKSTVESIPIKK